MRPGGDRHRRVRRLHQRRGALRGGERVRLPRVGDAGAAGLRGQEAAVEKQQRRQGRRRRHERGQHRAAAALERRAVLAARHAAVAVGEAERAQPPGQLLPAARQRQRHEVQQEVEAGHPRVDLLRRHPGEGDRVAEAARRAVEGGALRGGARGRRLDGEGEGEGEKAEGAKRPPLSGHGRAGGGMPGAAFGAVLAEHGTAKRG